MTRRRAANHHTRRFLATILLLGAAATMTAGCAQLGLGRGDRVPKVLGEWPEVRDTIDVHVHLRRGDSLAKVLRAQGIGHQDSVPWFDAVGQVYDLRRLQPGRGMTLQFDRPTRQLAAIRYEVDDTNLLVAERRGDEVVAQRLRLPYFVEIQGVSVQIRNGFQRDAARAGLPSNVAAQVGDIFAWEMDVENGLAPGDEIRVLYENLWETGGEHGYAGKVLGAELLTEEGRTVAMLFEDASGIGGYYRPDGKSLTRSLLRYPVEFTEITSRYSLSRFHPILRRRRPHFGVDFAAPHGTPVRSAGDGRVREAKWVGGLGRAVRIDHAGGMTSTYGHLSRVAPGLRQGSHVERGQVIGYVGATGLATGPHLHYEIEVNGLHVDPLGNRVASTTPNIDPRSWKAFTRRREKVLTELARLPLAQGPRTVSRGTFRAE